MTSVFFFIPLFFFFFHQFHQYRSLSVSQSSTLTVLFSSAVHSALTREPKPIFLSLSLPSLSLPPLSLSFSLSSYLCDDGALARDAAGCRVHRRCAVCVRGCGARCRRGKAKVVGGRKHCKQGSERRVKRVGSGGAESRGGSEKGVGCRGVERRSRKRERRKRAISFVSLSMKRKRRRGLGEASFGARTERTKGAKSARCAGCKQQGRQGRQREKKRDEMYKEST